jgi:hypothetical protein
VRRIIILIGAALPLALTAPAAAQQSQGAVFMSNFSGVNPRNINFVPLDTTKAMKNLNVNSAFRTPQQSQSLSLSSLFPKFQLGSWPPIVPNTPVLSQKNNQFQPNPILGKNLFGPTPITK